MTDRRTRTVEHERRTIAAVFARDQATMRALVSPVAFGLDATEDGVWPRPACDLVELIGRLSEDARYGVENVRVALAGPDVAVIAYRQLQWADLDGAALPAAVRCTSVWLIEDERWQAVFHQETPDAGPD